MNRFFKIVMLMFLSIFIFTCSRDETTALDQEKAKKLPDQEIWNFQAKSTVNGRLEALIHAGHMQRYSREELML